MKVSGCSANPEPLVTGLHQSFWEKVTLSEGLRLLCQPGASCNTSGAKTGKCSNWASWVSFWVHGKSAKILLQSCLLKCVILLYELGHLGLDLAQEHFCVGLHKSVWEKVTLSEGLRTIGFPERPKVGLHQSVREKVILSEGLRLRCQPGAPCNGFASTGAQRQH